MRRIGKKTFLACVMIIVTAGLVQAGTKGRIITNGKVTMYKNNQVVSSYTNQGPIDENALMACSGTCMVKMQGISLSGVDQTRFALKESTDSVNLYLEKGKIYFLVTDTTHRFAFFMPDGYYVRTEGFIAPASTGSSVKGSIQTTDDSTEIAMESGTMIVQTTDGAKTIKPGQALVIAMANPPDKGKTAAKDIDDRGAVMDCAFFDWSCKTPIQQIGIAGAGVGLTVGIGYLTYLDHTDQGTGETGAGPDDDKKPEPKPKPKPPSASPNR
jgi:hypothetical protein